jgi:hypothetical protein
MSKSPGNESPFLDAFSFLLFWRDMYGNGFWEMRSRFPKRRFVFLSRFPNLFS